MVGIPSVLEARNPGMHRKHREKTAVSTGDQSPELSVMNLILPLDRTARDIMLVAEMV